MAKTNIIRPQAGLQEFMTRCNVDFCICGGVLACGKAQPLDSKVLTPIGFVNIGSLKVGDFISNPTGGSQQVEQIFDRGWLKCYKVEFDDGTFTRCCNEHLWKVWDNVKKTHRVVELNDIINDGMERYSIPLASAVEFENKNELPIEPYLFGLIIGDGHIQKNISCSTTICTDLENIQRAYNRSEFSYTYHSPKNRPSYIIITDKKIRKKLCELGLYGKLSHTKFIPEQYKNTSIENRIELLRGLIDTDGYVDKKSYRIEYCTVSEELCNDVLYIARSLGAKVSVSEKIGHYRKNGEKVICKKTYRLSIRMRNLDSIVTLDRKSVKRTQCREIRKKIKDIRFVGMEQMRCILVTGDDHTYITDGFTVTHNTFGAVMSIAEPASDPKFRSLFLRNNLGDLKAGGSIIDTFREVYGDGVRIVESGEPRVIFPSGAYVDVTHVADQSRDKIMQRFKGRQYDHIYFDEGTGFTWECFTSIYSRNRGTAKWTGHVMMTTNPEREHWIRSFIDWYIGADGFIREDRSGIVRYFYINGETVKDVVWGDSKEEVYQKCAIDINNKLSKINGSSGNAKWSDLIKSFTFYLGRMSENKATIGHNQGYIGSVAMTGGRVAQQLLEGNWNVSMKDELNSPITTEDANFVFLNDPQTNNDKWITCDLADTGTDNFLALAWDGFHIYDCLILNKTTPRENAERLHIFAVEHDIADTHIIYDAVRGTYINDYIPDAVQYISYRSPMGLYGRFAMKLKDECYLRLVEALKRHNISMSEKVYSRIYDHAKMKDRITIQNEFIEECVVVRFRDTNNGKKTLYSKKEMNQKLGKSRSMDLLDPCAMRMLPVLQYAYGEELEKSAAAVRGEQDESYDYEEEYNSVNVFDEHTWY